MRTVMLESVSVKRRTKSSRAIAAGLIALTMLAWLPVVHASALPLARNLHRIPIEMWSTWPLQADLDGDRALDSVKLSSSGYDKTIDIKFGSLRISEFSFAADPSDRGTLIARDIDRDGDVDLIWIANREQKSAVVLINDGNGDFTRAKDSAEYATELSALLNCSDPTDQDSLQVARHTVSLFSSSFSSIGPIANRKLPYHTIQSISFVGANGFSNRAAFLSYLHKRGPPLTIS